jgi:ribosomal protein S14
MPDASSKNFNGNSRDKSQDNSQKNSQDNSRHNSRHNKPGICCLCFRELALTFHHLIPRKVHRRSYFQKNYDRDSLNQGIFICTICHRGIHATYDEMTLARQFNSIEQLRQDAELTKHFAWAAKQKQR